MKKYWGLLILTLASICNAETEALNVSIIQLVATPERYYNKRVFLSAYVTVEFENMSLCAVQQPSSSKDCIWLNIDDGQFDNEVDIERYKKAEQRWLPLNHKRISLHGTFNQENTGHMGMWSGALEKNYNSLSISNSTKRKLAMTIHIRCHYYKS